MVARLTSGKELWDCVYVVFRSKRLSLPRIILSCINIFALGQHP